MQDGAETKSAQTNDKFPATRKSWGEAGRGSGGQFICENDPKMWYKVG